MATSTAKRSLRQAEQDAEEFQLMFPLDSWEVWETAGSVRRRRAEVGDIEHVIIPRFGELIDDSSLFGEKKPHANLLFVALDRLVADGKLTRHIYGATGHRWGEKYRGVDYRGFNHEIFIADHSNFGATLAIRTGPAEFSQKLVTNLRRQSHRNKDGYVWRCDKCNACDGFGRGCNLCNETGLMPVDKINVPDERTYFRLCGIPYLEPEKRLAGG